MTTSHPFETRPHRSLLGLALPVLIALVAEPITGMVDTFFVGRLGATPLAALGVASVLLSGIFWVFNFLGIGTQTEVARARGAGRDDEAARAAGLAMSVALLLGAGLALGSWPFLDLGLRSMGAAGSMLEPGRIYLQIRLLGAPAMLVVLASFGALRGLEDMRTPLKIAVLSNLLNAVLDPILIFGWGPIPALGIEGAAWASTASQWLAAVWAVRAIQKRLGLHTDFARRRLGALFSVGRDLALRTGLLLLFTLIATRVATRAGAEAGAAHQVVRQTWLLSALLLDAFAISAQSLIGYFLGRDDWGGARRVAGVATLWSLLLGSGLTLVLLGLTDLMQRAFVPAEARALFSQAWWILALLQPLSALAFVSDGIHWGTQDYRFLRNVMAVATGLGGLALLAVDVSSGQALLQVWLITLGWLVIRSVFGMLRIWPGLGSAPLQRRAVPLQKMR